MLGGLVTGLLAVFAADSSPQQVILVADVGVDDAAGLLLALSSPSLEVLGIAATFGCHKDVAVTARNAERLLAAANRSSVPVYRGAPFPLGSTDLMHGDGSYVHGADGFGNLPDDDASCSPAETGGVSAAEVIAQTARSAPGKVVLASFSPLTNVALALAIEPRLPMLLRSLVAMGGAVYCAGNAAPLAEANFMHDAHAARVVVHAFAQAGSLVLAPLDVTNPTIIAPEFIAQVRVRVGVRHRVRVGLRLRLSGLGLGLGLGLANRVDRADERGRQGGSDVHVGVANVSEGVLPSRGRVRRHTASRRAPGHVPSGTAAVHTHRAG